MSGCAWLLLVAVGCSSPESAHRTDVPRPSGPAIDEPPRTLVVIDAIADEDRVGGMSNDAMPGDPATPPPPPTARTRPNLAAIQALPGIDVVESANQASHVHGGDGASIDHASVNFLVKDGKTHTLEVGKLEMLRGHCRETTWTSRELLVVTGYAMYDWDSADPLAKLPPFAKVRLPAKPDLYSVSIGFDAFSVYQACDRFAFAIRMVVDGKPVELEVPLQVKRYEPIHRP